MIVLDGKTLSNTIKSDLKQWCAQQLTSQDCIVIFLLTQNPASTTYVRMKQQYAEYIGVRCVIEQPEIRSASQLISMIAQYNNDSTCKGIMIQLPLPDYLQDAQPQILSAISPHKDIDALSGVTRGWSLIGKSSVIPATAQGVMRLLDEYKLGQMQGKKVTVIGQSALVGLPLSTACIQRGASLYAFNKGSSPYDIKQATLESDYIMSAAGVPHLVTGEHIRPDKSQILIDIGRSMVDGKLMGDIDPSVQERVYAMTPVPGGVGPMTIASLFTNMKVLYELHHLIKTKKLLVTL